MFWPLVKGATAGRDAEPSITWRPGSPLVRVELAAPLAERPEFPIVTVTPICSPASKEPSPSPRSASATASPRSHGPAARAVRAKARRLSSARGTIRLWGGQKPSESDPISGVHE